MVIRSVASKENTAVPAQADSLGPLQRGDDFQASQTTTTHKAPRQYVLPFNRSHLFVIGGFVVACASLLLAINVLFVPGFMSSSWLWFECFMHITSLVVAIVMIVAEIRKMGIKKASEVPLNALHTA